MNLNVKICFDESHNEGGRLNTTYTGLKELLEKNGFECVSLTDFPITYDKLKKYNTLVIAGPDMSKFRPSEINDILKYVSDGGSLVLMSDAGGDSGHMTNLNRIAQTIAFQFNADQVIDQKSNLGVETVPILDQITPHEIMRGVASVSYRAGCSITVTGEALILLKSNQTSNPPNAPIIVLAKHGEGKVLGIGTYEIFRDRLLGGINAKYHSNLALNIFQYMSVYGEPAEGEGIVIEEIHEETSPLIKELAQIKDATQISGESKTQAESRIEEAKITPLKESPKRREQENLLRELSENVTSVSTMIKEQVYNLSDLHEKITVAERELENINSTIKNYRLNELYDNINNINTAFQKIGEDTNTLLKDMDNLKKHLETIKSTQDEYNTTAAELSKNIKSAINTSSDKLIKNIEAGFNRVGKISQELKNLIPETVRNIFQTYQSEFLNTQVKLIEGLEERLTEKINKLLTEFSKLKPVEETGKTPVSKEAEAAAEKPKVKKAVKKRSPS